CVIVLIFFFFFSSRRRHTRSYGDWSSDVCSSDLFEFARVGIEREQAVGVEVIARARRAVKVGRGVTRAPENGVEFRVKRTRHPSGASAEFVTLAGPTGGAEFAGSWNGPKTPRFLAGLGVVSRDKAAHAVVAS